MAYVHPNFKTKKALREALAKGETVTAYQPGGMFDLDVPPSGRISVEGPHYPEPHRWYALVQVDENRNVTRVVS